MNDIQMKVEKDLTDKYRRLRILYNRIMVFGTSLPYYSYGHEHVFHTSLGDRKIVYCCHRIGSEQETMDLYYEKDGHVLFAIEINKKRYDFFNQGMNEEQAWLAIHELEELSYKELEKYDENK